MYRFRSSKLSRTTRDFATRSSRSTHGSLRFETLEDRVLMNADNALAVAMSQDASEMAMMAADTSGATGEQTQTSALPDQFGSVEAARAWLIEQIDAQYGDKFGTTYEKYDSSYIVVWDWEWGGNRRIIEGSTIFPMVDLTAVDWLNSQGFDTSGVAFSATHSATNIQALEVDEADLVETDGQYLYVLSGNDLVIVEAGLGDDLKVASRVTLDHRPESMYLVGDQLVLLHNQLQGTEVTLLDISDREVPEVIQRTTLDGHLVSSRVVGDSLRMVLQSSITLPPLESTLVEEGGTSGSTENDPDKYLYETREEYLSRVGDQLLDLALPGYSSFTPGDGSMHEGLITDPSEMFRPKSESHRLITSIVSFDLSNPEPGPTDTVSLFARSSALVYASRDNIYLTETQGGSQTHISKIGFDDTTHEVELLAIGLVEGRVVDQFSLDEHDGYLRIVTSGNGGDGQNVFIMAQDNDCLETVGMITGIARGENLHSVRFMGDRGFFVTFRKVDPLFALDLSDPTNPMILGELKIPGFSDYLQPIDENHLIGIGRGADESRGRFQEMQVSLFDISDLTNPVLLDRYSFEGGRSTKSEALDDHHAVSYFGAEGVLAFPIHSTAHSPGFRFGVDNTPIWQPGQGALQVLRVDVSSGFEHLGQVQHDSLVHRSVRIGDHLFAISNGLVTVHNLTEPSTQLGAIAIGDATAETSLTLATFAQAQAERAVAVSQIMTLTHADLSPSVGASAGAERSEFSSVSPANFAATDLANVQLGFSRSLESSRDGDRYRVLSAFYSTHDSYYEDLDQEHAGEETSQPMSDDLVELVASHSS